MYKILEDGSSKLSCDTCGVVYDSRFKAATQNYLRREAKLASGWWSGYPPKGKRIGKRVDMCGKCLNGKKTPWPTYVKDNKGKV